MSAPYMPLFIGDYLADTTHLTRSEHGAYLLLLMAMWRAGGKLPNDPARLARIALASPSEWDELQPVMMTFFKRRGGHITHERLAREFTKYVAKSDALSRAGKRGAQEKRNKNNGNATSQASPQEQPGLSNQNHNQNHIEVGGVVETREAVSADWPDAAPMAVLVALANSPFLDPTKSPGLITTSGEIVRWRQAGCSWDQDVVPTIQGETAKGRSPFRSWAYFTAAVLRQRDRRLTDLPSPQPEEAHERSRPANRVPGSDDRLDRMLSGLVAAVNGPAT